MKENRNPKINQHDFVKQSMTKEGRVYSGEKTISSMIGAGKTGSLRSEHSLTNDLKILEENIDRTCLT